MFAASQLSVTYTSYRGLRTVHLKSQAIDIIFQPKRPIILFWKWIVITTIIVTKTVNFFYNKIVYICTIHIVYINVLCWTEVYAKKTDLLITNQKLIFFFYLLKLMNVGLPLNNNQPFSLHCRLDFYWTLFPVSRVNRKIFLTSYVQ